MLSGIEGVKQAPYFAKGQWVCVPREVDLSKHRTPSLSASILPACGRGPHEEISSGIRYPPRMNVSDSIGH